MVFLVGSFLVWKLSALRRGSKNVENVLFGFWFGFLGFLGFWFLGVGFLGFLVFGRWVFGCEWVSGLGFFPGFGG